MYRPINVNYVKLQPVRNLQVVIAITDLNISPNTLTW